MTISFFLSNFDIFFNSHASTIVNCQELLDALKWHDMGWDILGHEWAAEMLRQHIAQGTRKHAYLFAGPPGVGRRTLALRFAQAVNCLQPTEIGAPCGTCRTCQQIARMQQADLTIVQSEAVGESIKVDQIRDLRRTLALAPYESAYRVALLLRFNEATEEAQNALLKTMEEPNPKVLLLLTVDEPENLQATIVSRCELLRLRPMPIEELRSVLVERKGVDEERAHLIAHVAGGRPGYAFRFIEDEGLWASRDAWVNDFFTLLDSNLRKRLAYSESKTRGKERAEARLELRDGLAHWLSLWRDVLLKCSGSGTALTNIDREREITRLAERLSERDAAYFVGRLEHNFARLATANLQLMLDNLLLEWPRI